MSTPIVRAIDVGFGRTKVATTDLQHDPARSFERTAFPSLVVASGKLRGTMFIDPDCGEVEADGRLWRTVADDLSEVSAGTSRFQTANFYTSSEYLALLRAGLAKMTLPRPYIDCLGIGMPYNVMRENPGVCAELERRVVGDHPVPTSAGAVTVRRVYFAPQGVAALVRMLAVEPLLRGAPDNIRLLTVDAGYGTLLWCTSHGKRVSAMGTDGCFGSVASALREIALEVDRANFANVQLTQAIDDALRLGQPIRWAGRLHERQVQADGPGSDGELTERAHAERRGNFRGLRRHLYQWRRRAAAARADAAHPRHRGSIAPHESRGRAVPQRRRPTSSCPPRRATGSHSRRLRP